MESFYIGHAMPHLLNNTVIKNLSPEMGKEIIQVYKDDGWDTGAFEGTAFEGHSTYYHYGVIDGDFNNHCLQRIHQSKAKAKIITIEQAKQIIKPMKQKQITLTVEQAKELLGKSPEMDSLIRANFTEQELKGRVKKWAELGDVQGWVIDENGKVKKVFVYTSGYINRTVYATEAQALAFGIAAPMLSQLMKEKNGDWVADWMENNMKYCIENVKDGISKIDYYHTKQFLAFPTPESRDEFLSDHRDLITQYFNGF